MYLTPDEGEEEKTGPSSSVHELRDKKKRKECYHKQV